MKSSKILLIFLSITLLLTGCGGKKPKDKEEPKFEGITTKAALENSMSFDSDLNAIIAIDKDGNALLGRREPLTEFDAALEWSDLVQVEMCMYEIYGLKGDGTVVSSDEELDLSGFTGITGIDASNKNLYGLKKDGTMVSTDPTSPVYEWKNVVQFSVNGDTEDNVIALCKDGSVLVCGYDAVLPAAEWTDIVQVSSGRLHVAGLKSDGTVIAAGRPLFEDRGFVGELDVDDWTDVVYISCGNQTTAGLKSDGTVLATGYAVDSESSQERVSSLEEVIAISAEANTVVALTYDGKISGDYRAEEWDLNSEK